MMSEAKSEVEYVIKTGRQIVEKKQVDNTEQLSSQIDAVKLLYNELGAQVNPIPPRFSFSSLELLSISRFHYLRCSFRSPSVRSSGRCMFYGCSLFISSVVKSRWLRYFL